MWPFRRRSADASPPGDDADGGEVLRPARAEWRSVEPLRPVQATPLSTIDRGFEQSLTTRARPLFIDSLSHHVHPSAPAGTVDGLAVPSPGRRRRRGADVSPRRPPRRNGSPAPMSRRRRAVQRVAAPSTRSRPPTRPPTRPPARRAGDVRRAECTTPRRRAGARAWSPIADLGSGAAAHPSPPSTRRTITAPEAGGRRAAAAQRAGAASRRRRTTTRRRPAAPPPDARRGAGGRAGAAPRRAGRRRARRAPDDAHRRAAAAVDRRTLVGQRETSTDDGPADERGPRRAGGAGARSAGRPRLGAPLDRRSPDPALARRPSGAGRASTTRCPPTRARRRGRDRRSRPPVRARRPSRRRTIRPRRWRPTRRSSAATRSGRRPRPIAPSSSRRRRRRRRRPARRTSPAARRPPSSAPSSTRRRRRPPRPDCRPAIEPAATVASRDVDRHRRRRRPTRPVGSACPPSDAPLVGSGRAARRAGVDRRQPATSSPASPGPIAATSDPATRRAASSRPGGPTTTTAATGRRPLDERAAG